MVDCKLHETLQYYASGLIFLCQSIFRIKIIIISIIKYTKKFSGKLYDKDSVKTWKNELSWQNYNACSRSFEFKFLL